MIAEKANISLPRLSLLWLISLKEINKIIIGVDSKNQLLDHLDTVSLKVSSELFDAALNLNYNNPQILNPSLWQ